MSSKKILFVPLVLCVLLLSQMAEECFADASAQLKQAETYKKEGKYEQAEAIYKTVAADYPGTEDAFQAQKNLAMLYVLWQKQPQADAALQQLVANYSSHKDIAQAVNNIAYRYRRLQKYEKAKQLYQYVLNNWPQAEHALWSQMYLAKLNVKLGNDAAAEAAIDKLLTDFSGHESLAEAVYQAADKYRKSEKYEEAYKLYQHTVDNWPQDKYAMWSQMYLAKLNVKLGNDAAAEAAIDKLLTDFSGHKDIAAAVRDIASHYRDSGKYDRARQLYQHVVDNWPTSEYAMSSQKGVALSNIALGDDSNAQAAIDKLLTDFSGHERIAQAVHYIANKYRALQKYDKANQLYQYVVDNCPGSKYAMSLQKGIAISNIALGDDSNAQAAIDKLLTNFSGHKDIAAVVHDIASQYRDSGKYDRACQLYQHLVDNWPASEYGMSSQKGVALSNIALGDDPNTQAAVGKLIADFNDHPTLPAAFCDIARRYESSGKYEEAKGVYQQIIQRYPDSPQADRAQLDVSRINILGFIRSGRDADAQVAVDKLIADFNDRPTLPEAVFVIGEKYYDMASQKQSQGLKKASNECFAKAIGIWQKNIKELSESTHTTYAWYYSAAAYRRMGQLEKTIEYYQKVVSDWPDHELACNAQFMIGQSFEHFAEEKLLPSSEAEELARAAYQQLLDKYPNCPNAEYSRRWIKRYDSEKGGNPK